MELSKLPTNLLTKQGRDTNTPGRESQQDKSLSIRKVTFPFI